MWNKIKNKSAEHNENKYQKSPELWYWDIDNIKHQNSTDSLTSLILSPKTTTWWTPKNNISSDNITKLGFCGYWLYLCFHICIMERWSSLLWFPSPLQLYINKNTSITKWGLVKTQKAACLGMQATHILSMVKLFVSNCFKNFEMKKIHVYRSKYIYDLSFFKIW